MKRLLVAVLLIANITFGCVVALYGAGIYLPGQRINDIDVSFKRKSDVYNALIEKDRSTIAFKYKGAVNVFDDIENVVNSDELTISFSDWVKRTPITVNIGKSYDSKSLEDFICGLYSPMDNAYIECDAGMWVLHEEVYGCDFNIDDVVNVACELPYVINLDDFVDTPAVTASDLQSTWSKLSWLNNFEISYTCGYRVNSDVLNKYVDNCVLKITLEDCEAIVKEFEQEYCTKNLSLSLFSTYINEYIDISYKTFGKELNVSKEAQYLYDAILTHVSESNRTPYTIGYDDFSDTYVEVSIDGQHCWYYKDGNLVMDTDIVTGHKGRHDTPKGVYYITECISGKYLVGEGYKTWVNRWMRLTNSGVGLHDASWRSSFGKQIYTYNGSHGCINLPKNWAYEFYKEAYVGMPVVIY